MKVATVEEMRALDSRAMREFSIPEEILMENAGMAVTSVIGKEMGIKGRSFVVVCGPGNNGGDGLVVARKLHSLGGDVRVFLMSDPGRYKGSSRVNYDIIRSFPLDVVALESAGALKSALYSCDAVVDAMLGTGLGRDVTGLYADVIELINASGKTVFSVDIPSGISGDTGAVMGVAVRASFTVTFGLPKLGNILYPGFEHCGKLYVSHISFPEALTKDSSIKVELNLPVSLPERGRDTHKGSFGRALFVSGSMNYFGAPYLSSMSFLKAGGGLSYLAAPSSVCPFIASMGCEVVFLPQKEKDGAISLEALDDILEFSRGVDIVVVGPGMSLSDDAKRLVREIVRRCEKPVVIDGDGITAVSEDLSVLEGRTHGTVLTPHPGEMSRITGKSVDEIKKDRVGVLREACEKLQSIVVLKGAHSLIGLPDGRVYVNMTGNPGMATAGSGDTLTGAIAAMFGLGLSLPDAVRMGVLVHGLSGDIAASEIGEDGVTAGDILEFMPYALRTLRDDKSFLDGYFPEVVV